MMMILSFSLSLLLLFFSLLFQRESQKRTLKLDELARPTLLPPLMLLLLMPISPGASELALS